MINNGFLSNHYVIAKDFISNPCLEEVSNLINKRVIGYYFKKRENSIFDQSNNNPQMCLISGILVDIDKSREKPFIIKEENSTITYNCNYIQTVELPYESTENLLESISSTIKSEEYKNITWDDILNTLMNKPQSFLKKEVVNNQ